MVDQKTIELLNATHEFPTAVMVKVIGYAKDGFVSRVVSTVREHLSVEQDPPYRFRQTRTGKHIAITLEPQFNSAEDVLDLYERLQSVEGIVMTL